jgi:hypothetical protein
VPGRWSFYRYLVVLGFLGLIALGYARLGYDLMLSKI